METKEIKPGTGQVGAPLKIQKEQSVQNIHGQLMVPFDYHTVRKIPEDLRLLHLRLENSFY